MCTKCTRRQLEAALSDSSIQSNVPTAKDDTIQTKPTGGVPTAGTKNIAVADMFVQEKGRHQQTKDSLERAVAYINRLEEALAFYANAENYRIKGGWRGGPFRTPVDRDRGGKAREVLWIGDRPYVAREG